MKFSFRLLLFPFSLLYCLITATRNLLYDRGIKKSTRYKIPVISIGNLTVGGTGKTPMSEMLIKMLLPEYQCAILSRGYGRKTRGPVLADEHASAVSIGDEPMQMKTKFPGLTVMVAEQRTLGMELLLKQTLPPEVVLLDDAYQHRAVTPGLSILVMDYFRPVYKDFCLPAGNLREPGSGKKRADILVVNKCPKTLDFKEKDSITKKINPTPQQKIYFSSIGYGTLQPINEKASFEITKKTKIPVLAIAGIGNPAPFFKEAAGYASRLEKIAFPDHHDFSDADIQKISNELQKLGSEAIVVTTEKDAVRLRGKDLSPLLSQKIWYIPIELEILFNEQDSFFKTVKNYVGKNQ